MIGAFLLSGILKGWFLIVALWHSDTLAVTDLFPVY